MEKKKKNAVFACIHFVQNKCVEKEINNAITLPTRKYNTFVEGDWFKRPHISY